MNKRFGAGPLVLAVIAVAGLGLLWFTWSGDVDEEAPGREAIAARGVPPAGMPMAKPRSSERRAERRDPGSSSRSMGGEPETRDRRVVGGAGEGRAVGDRQRVPKRAAAGADESTADEPARMPDETFDVMRAKALSDPDPEERIRALESLDAYGGDSAVPVLTQALSDQDPEVRLAALEELTFVTDNPPLDALSIALGDSDPDVRAAALRIVADSEDESRWPLIHSALKDPDEDVRGEAEDIVEMDGGAGEEPE